MFTSSVLQGLCTETGWPQLCTWERKEQGSSPRVKTLCPCKQLEGEPFPTKIIKQRPIWLFLPPVGPFSDGLLNSSSLGKAMFPPKLWAYQPPCLCSNWPTKSHLEKFREKKTPQKSLKTRVSRKTGSLDPESSLCFVESLSLCASLCVSSSPKKPFITN